MLTRRLTLLTEDLLAAATMEYGDLVVRPEVVDLNQQLGECATCFPDLDVELDCPPALAAYADPLRLQQILANLVRNAQKHGAEPVLIAAAPDPLVAGGVTIRVSDAGPGVPATFVPRLFDRYTQGTVTATGGSGLGLSVVRDLVSAHHGTIGYDGDTNAFFFTLPPPAAQRTRGAQGPQPDTDADTDADDPGAGRGPTSLDSTRAEWGLHLPRVPRRRHGPSRGRGSGGCRRAVLDRPPQHPTRHGVHPGHPGRARRGAGADPGLLRGGERLPARAARARDRGRHGHRAVPGPDRSRGALSVAALLHRHLPVAGHGGHPPRDLGGRPRRRRAAPAGHGRTDARTTDARPDPHPASTGHPAGVAPARRHHLGPGGPVRRGHRAAGRRRRTPGDADRPRRGRQDPGRRRGGGDGARCGGARRRRPGRRARPARRYAGRAGPGHQPAAARRPR